MFNLMLNAILHYNAQDKYIKKTLAFGLLLT
jgi:hypothetical protein